MSQKERTKNTDLKKLENKNYIQKEKKKIKKVGLWLSIPKLLHTALLQTAAMQELFSSGN